MLKISTSVSGQKIHFIRINWLVALVVSLIKATSQSLERLILNELVNAFQVIWSMHTSPVACLTSPGECLINRAIKDCGLYSIRRLGVVLLLLLLLCSRAVWRYGVG